MAVGDIVKTTQPVPVQLWRTKASADTSVAGSPVGFDSSGDIIIAVDTTDGPLGMLTTNTKEIATVDYFGVLIFGIGVMTAGGNITINKFVSVDSGSDVIATTTTVSTAFVQSEIQALWRVLGMYLGLEADPATDDYAMSDAVNTNLIMVFVGRTP